MDETSGRPLLEAAKVSTHIRAKSIDLVGQYGISIAWTEAPCANIYSFVALRAMCTCAACAESPKRSV